MDGELGEMVMRCNCLLREGLCESLRSFTDYDAILKAVNASYPIGAQRMCLHRDMIGRVYFIDGPDRRTVFKLYRSSNTDGALRSTRVLQYLRNRGYPAVPIIPTVDGELSIKLSTPEGLCVGILYDHIEGTTPDIKAEIEHLGLQVGRLHSLMDEYPYPLPEGTKDQYIDDYIAVMKEAGYAPARVLELQEYGDELWERLKELPRSFCHGDMHTGNMLMTNSGDYVLFDFDEVSGDYPVVDVAYLSDSTNFNRFDEKAHDATIRMFDRFYKGYSKERTLSGAEIGGILGIVAIRHYTILGRIIRCQGLAGISPGFFDQQHEWLLRWRELCQ